MVGVLALVGLVLSPVDLAGWRSLADEPAASPSPGQGSETPSPSPSEATSGDLTPDEAGRLSPDEAVAYLGQLVGRDRSVIQGLAGSWVPQVASACVGARAFIDVIGQQGESTVTQVTAPQIAALHSEVAERYGAVLTSAAELGVTDAPAECVGGVLWVSLVPEQYPSSTGVITWCTGQVIALRDCAARFVAAD